MADLSIIRNGDDIPFRKQISLTAKLAAPAILAQLSNIIMQYIDASMVGRLGADGSASVGLVLSSLWLFWGICSAATVGFSVLVAHRLGAKEPEEARNVVRQGIVSVFIVTIFLAVVGVAISPWLPAWLGGEENICHDASLYFGVWMAGLPLVSMSYLAGGVLRSAGNMKVPTILNIIMCILDVAFNWFLIFPSRHIHIFGSELYMPGFGLGVLGAALGTVLAETTIAGVMFWYMAFRQPDTRLTHNDNAVWRPTSIMLHRVLKISIPMALEHVVFCGAQVMITIIVAPLGVIAIAANAFAVTAESLCYMPGFGISDAATTLVGQSYGAKRIPLVKRFCHLSVGLGIVIMTFMGVIMYLAAPLMMEILSDVPAIVSLGTEILRIEAWAEPLYAASIVAYGAFIGVGDTMIPAIMNFGSIWAVRIPLAALLAPTMRLRGVWIAMAIELSFRGIIFLWRMWSERWLKNTDKDTDSDNGNLSPEVDLI